MTFVVLAVLAIVWILVLGSYARERMADRRRDTVSAFRTQLTTLQRTHAAPSRSLGSVRRQGAASSSRASARSDDMARRRRKNVLLGLLTVAMLSTMLVVVAVSAVTVIFAVVSVGALAGYVALLVDRQRVIAERRAKVHPIRTAPRAPRPAASGRVVAMGSGRR